ncbi:PTS transporter subunit EIIB [Ureaplasma canigenitalium]|uniref:PTS transporter subunit EIIB n=1 Tax=Ureaplasma canigenitalium TaxID=42092 RepID=UPI0004E28073|nr:PTS transporter subunit EIIB [Ureaplasma canigenitalium]
MKKNWKIILLYIFTFGIAYFVLRAKAKKRAKMHNEQLSITEKLPFDINDFYSYVGMKDNILDVDATINTLKLQVKDKELINKDNLKKLGVKGILSNGQQISLVIGDFSLKLKEIIKKDIFNV